MNHKEHPARMLCRVLLLAGALLQAVVSFTDAQEVPWWSTAALHPGPTPVGFTTRMLVDSTRLTRSHHPRAVQLGIWYPASRIEGSVLTYAEYLGIAATETTDVHMANLNRTSAALYSAFLASQSIPDSVINLWFSSPMLAAYDAPAAKDAAPLVLLAQGNGETAVDQCVLGEYLASCGYVVATSPSQSRITGQPDSEGNVGLAAEDQADDLALIRNTLRSRSNILQTEIGVVGHSFGARSALLLAMRDSTVRCLVSLDGGIGTATARSSFESSRSFRPLALRIPLLHFYEELDPPMAPNWGTLDKLVASDIWIARANGLHHHHFTALGAASSRYTEVGKETRATNDVGTQYAAILDLTRAFLDAALRGDISSRDRFERGSADVHPQHLPR